MKYWVYLNGEIPGSYAPDELVSLPGFQETAMVCPADGGVEERNWRMAGQFPDIIRALQARIDRGVPAAPVDPGPEPGPARTPDDVLNDASSKIFGHVTELMKELENRREEKALTQSLQRQMIELKNELQALRERNQYLQERAELLPEFQKRESKLEKKIHDLEADAQTREDRLAQAEEKIKSLRVELERTKSGEKGLSEDLIRQTKLTEELAAEMSQKELQLARAFGIISKLEAMLGDIVPGATAGMIKSSQTRSDDVDIPETRGDSPLEPSPERLSEEGTEPEPPIRVIPEEAVEPEPPAAAERSSERVSEDILLKEPDWPAEGEVKPVDPPWRERLKKAKNYMKEFLEARRRPAAGSPAPDEPSDPS